MSLIPVEPDNKMPGMTRLWGRAFKVIIEWRRKMHLIILPISPFLTEYQVETIGTCPLPESRSTGNSPQFSLLIKPGDSYCRRSLDHAILICGRDCQFFHHWLVTPSRNKCVLPDAAKTRVNNAMHSVRYSIGLNKCTGRMGCILSTLPELPAIE